MESLHVLTSATSRSLLSRLRFVLLAGCLGLVGSWMAPSSHAADDDRLFESKIRPVLVERCFGCHGQTKTSGGLKIESRESLLRGGESGPAIVPGKPGESLLLRAIRRQDDVSAMPPEKSQALRADQIADFEKWIAAGAVWPATSPKLQGVRHWAFEPLREPRVPDVRDANWARTPIDRFILAKQEAAGIRPAPPADKRTLLRRVTFDLTGLPPTFDETQAFLRDESPDAFETVVERLLRSPAYGERWGRHWLDVVRYADTAGETADYPSPQAWRYRNYVIDAFNRDKPYDEFLREQIAGDLLAAAGPRELYAERTTATGFLAISRRFGFDSENYHHLTIQDTIDTLGQAVLGLSLGCARCHDHKFDDVSMRDYYGLYGIFASSRYPFPGSEQKQKIRSLAPLVPPREAFAAWDEYAARVTRLVGELQRLKQPVPPAVLRSLHDDDGDFELQAAAAGGSNGVLVSPWLYEGKINVTGPAQSPFKNLFPTGRFGVQAPGGTGAYWFAQSLLPRPLGADGRLYTNLDFRLAPGPAEARGVHRWLLGSRTGAPAVELLLGTEGLLLRQGDSTEKLGQIAPGEWLSLQLELDPATRSFAGRLGKPGSLVELPRRPLQRDWNGTFDYVRFDSGSSEPPANGAATVERPVIEYDHFALRAAPIAPPSLDVPLPTPASNSTDDLAAIDAQLQALVGVDGDLELQTKDRPPERPWNPGPNSLVKLSASSQSPYRNLYGAGELGLHLPNRGEYDGFGLTLSNVKPDKDGRLYASFDFRCVAADAGGGGSWRYYLGHGAGNSPAFELYWNANEFFVRNGDAKEKESIGAIRLGQWYQVQVTLDMKARTFTGTLQGKPTGVPEAKIETRSFSGRSPSAWDGQIDYTFIDSYGHLGGVRPSLDADNFLIRDQAMPPLDAPSIDAAEASGAARRAKVAELGRRLSEFQAGAESRKQELNSMLVDGPFPLAYAMSDGTPHDERMQLRGEPDRPGELVPRGFIQVLGGGTLPAETAGSGRLELAAWITRPDHPLTARVMVNRIWQYHFGRGLVRTPNDFGVRGQKPTHPELLDHLAVQFIRSGWSVKEMHRQILRSAAYRQASTADTAVPTDSSAALELYARFARRRLSAEEIRDAILATSGELNATVGREHPFPSPLAWGFSQHGPYAAVYDHDRRSVYLMTQRLKRHPFLALFDGSDPNATTADRLITTVPTQALFFLNDSFVHAKADAWSRRLLAAAGDDAARVTALWRGALARDPTPAELADDLAFLAVYRRELGGNEPGATDPRAFAALARTQFGGNEFLHVD